MGDLMTFMQRDAMQRQLVRVGEERHRQHAKWGAQDHLGPQWLSILAEEFGEVSKEVVEIEWGDDAITPRLVALETEIVQTAAVCVAWLEDLARRRMRRYAQRSPQ
jgi:hypothetical protein